MGPDIPATPMIPRQLQAVCRGEAGCNRSALHRMAFGCAHEVATLASTCGRNASRSKAGHRGTGRKQICPTYRNPPHLDRTLNAMTVERVGCGPTVVLDGGFIVSTPRPRSGAIRAMRHRIAREKPHCGREVLAF
jgi:hypothetical protein